MISCSCSLVPEANATCRVEAQARQKVKAKVQREATLTALMDLRFRDNSYGKCARGLEGLKVADRLLRERNYGGILIGGLAEAVYNNGCSEESLDAHKDVDVLIWPYGYGLRETFEEFEGGIDWWSPNNPDAFPLNTIRYSNGNGITLPYTFNSSSYRLRESGLYFLSPADVIQTRILSGKEEFFGDDEKFVDSEVAERFERCVKDKFADIPLGLIESEFGEDRILGEGTHKNHSLRFMASGGVYHG